MKYISKILKSQVVHYFLLAVILIFAFSLRFYKISSIPAGSLIDEAHFGYLAYSLLETGKDEHGVSWPVIFTGFGDYKLPLGTYVLLPFVQFFGLNNGVIRYPSVIAGTLLVLGAYLLVRQVTKNREFGLIGALITATAPWTFILSRFGFESNLALCALMFALWLSFRGLDKKSVINLAFAGFLYGLTWYAYIAYRPFTFLYVGLLCVALVILYKRASIKYILAIAVPFILLISVFFAPSLSKSNTARYEQVGIFSDIGIVLVIDESRTFCGVSIPSLACYSVWNKPSLVAEILLNRFISSLSPDYLFIAGEQPPGGMFSARGFALLFSLLLPFYVLGFAGYFFVRESTLKEEIIKALILLGLLAAPIPAVLAGDPQRVRISVLFPFILLTIIFGIKIVVQKISNKNIRTAFLLVIIFLITISSYRYSMEWFGVHVSKYDLRYQSYVPGLMEFLHSSIAESSVNVLIKPFFSDPLMFYAYYTKMNPADYQRSAQLGVLEDSGFQHTVELGTIKVANLSPAETVCAFLPTSQPIYFVTDEKLGFPLVYSGRSTNGVHAYVNVYDLTLFSKTVACEAN